MNARFVFTLCILLGLAAGCVPPPALPSPTSPTVNGPATTATVPAPQAPASTPAQSQNSGVLTARMLTAPNALMGPVPSSFNWQPGSAALAYVDSDQNGQDVLWLYDASTGQKRLLFDPSASSDKTIDVTAALWSPQDDKMLLPGDQALWLLDVQTGGLKSLAQSQSPKTGLMFTPDGQQVTFVQDNDLYLVQVGDGQIRRLTDDGSATVLNGGLDWVYNEELATRAAQPAYAWSPDGKWLIFLRTDDNGVQSHSVTDYRPVPPAISYTRYPVVGTANPQVSLHALSVQPGQGQQVVPLPAGTEYILPFFTWTPDGQEALYATVNRDHTDLELTAWNPATGATRTVLKETDPYWINEDRYAAPVFIGNGQQFLWISERDGFMHLYLYSQKGELIRQLTQGSWMIDSTPWNMLTPGRPVHVDPTGTWAYIITTRQSPLERQLDRVNIATGQVEQVSQGAGFHALALSENGQYLVDQYSNITTPPVTQILKADGSNPQVLDRAAGPTLALPDLTREFLTLKAGDGTPLYAQIVKPAGFDATHKYPVVIHWYGGSGHQMVSNRYGSTYIFNSIERDVLYTQAGFIVWRLDNRGSFGRGHAFETPVFGKLGPVELDDQLAGVEYLGSLPYVDATRIGTDGKSYGGYMTLYALIHAPDRFRCGVAGAPPTAWSYYDTIYTERYMRTPQANPDGFAATNLVDAAGQMQAAPLLIHGLADRNVHLQNTINFIQALEAADKAFDFIPLPNLDHSFKGDGLVAALSASTDYFVRWLGTSE
jgi:dipeptidyl-peptidase 4